MSALVCRVCERPMVGKTETRRPEQARVGAKGMCTGCYAARRNGNLRRPAAAPHGPDGSSILRAAVSGNVSVQGTALYVTAAQCERVRALLVGAGLAEMVPAFGIEALS